LDLDLDLDLDSRNASAVRDGICDPGSEIQNPKSKIQNLEIVDHESNPKNLKLMQWKGSAIPDPKSKI